MVMFLSFPAKIIRLLEANVSPREIAAGVCLGMFMGFIPLNGPMAVLLFLFFLFFKLNRVSTVLTLPIFKLIYVLGGSFLIEKVGGYLLIDASFLAPFWAWLTGLPVICFLDINNTLVAGGLAVSGVLFVPVYLAARIFAAKMQEKYNEKLKNKKLFRWFRKIPLVDRISSYISQIKEGL